MIMSIGMVEMKGLVTDSLRVVGDPRLQQAIAETRRISLGGDGVSEGEVQQMVEQMQDHIDSMNISLQYTTYGDHGERIAVTVVNKDTGELIREIPSKEIQDLYAKMSELAGMIFNRQI
jgi:flagellar protein FlaG